MKTFDRRHENRKMGRGIKINSWFERRRKAFEENHKWIRPDIIGRMLEKSIKYY
jgi:hypothetical protein